MVRTFILSSVAILGACSSEPPVEWRQSDGALATEATVETINVIDTGRAALRILSDAPQAETYRIAFRGEGEDRLGNPTSFPLYEISFRGADVAAANWGNFDNWQTLNIASDISIQSGIGRQLITEHCGSYADLCEKI